MKPALAIAALLLLASPAFARSPLQCDSPAGCCINGVQFQSNFFPFCSSKRKQDCIERSEEFKRAAALCKSRARKP